MLIASGAVLRHPNPGERQISWLVWSLVASAYAFALAVFLRGIVGP
ncbi:MAG TPA: hypothetical protein VLG48_03145 [Candidatus Methylomirabilis sp.]|nr:hypothetical protein [Candidatus Methylomirabilis sp.]